MKNSLNNKNSSIITFNGDKNHDLPLSPLPFYEKRRDLTARGGKEI
jgi:hypothetical protein